MAAHAGRIAGFLLQVRFLVCCALVGWVGFLLLVMVFTQSKAAVGKSVCSQIEPSKKDASVQTPFCGEYWSLSLVPGASQKKPACSVNT